VACGFATRGISVIGDFGLAHSGIIGLINAVRFEADILVIVLNNHIAAMTGGQEVPDLINVVKQLSEDVVSIDGNNTSEAALEKLILEKLGQKGISVIFVEGRCTKYSIKEDI
jgi:indolepyruvate ferredoxin oxidoreductase alpha subunit